MTNFAHLRCAFLDRDGCINRPPPSGYVTRADEMELLPEAAGAILQLNKAGIKVVVVTNQHCIHQGLCTEADLAAIHERMCQLLSREGAHIDAIYYCPHGRDCRVCRKPATGMFERAFSDFPEITPETSVTIGNAVSDIEAGLRAGTRTILITDAAPGNGLCCDAVVLSLGEAVGLMLAGVKGVV